MYIIDPDIHTHFYAMINSVITVLILVGILGVILLKTLRKDGGSSSHEDMDYKVRCIKRGRPKKNELDF